MNKRNISRARRRAVKKRQDNTAGAQGSSVSAYSLLRGCFFGILGATAFSLLLSVLATAMTLHLEDPAALAPKLGVFTLCLSLFVGGAVSAAVSKGGALPCGIITSVGFMLLSLIPSALFSMSSPIGGALGVTVRLIAITLSVLGAYLSKNRLRSKPRRVKR